MKDIMSNWIDAHIHLTDPRIKADLGSFLRDAREAGITRFVLGGLDPEEWERQKSFTREYPGMATLAFGLHPWWVATQNESESSSIIDVGLEKLENELKSGTCKALGETGLDFHPRFSVETHALQENTFRAQLALARRYGIPVILHIVRAHDRALEILRESGGGYTGIVHSFSDEPRLARAYLELGLTPSICASVITRGKGSAFEKLKQTVVTLTPAEFVFETDAPDQPPAGESGLNRASNLIRVAEEVAKLRASKYPGTSAGTLLDQSRENLERIFKGIE
jgi:TatD DNase family protein